MQLFKVCTFYVRKWGIRHIDKDEDYPHQLTYPTPRTRRNLCPIDSKDRIFSLTFNLQKSQCAGKQPFNYSVQ